jgi:hypothetical protein
MGTGLSRLGSSLTGSLVGFGIEASWASTGLCEKQGKGEAGRAGGGILAHVHNEE